MGWVVIEKVAERSSYLDRQGVGNVIDVDISVKRSSGPSAGSYFSVFGGQPTPREPVILEPIKQGDDVAKRAICRVTVAGTNITARLLPVLHQLTVTDNVGTHSDTANLEIDDTNGRIVLPLKGAPVTIALGWQDGGVRVVFTGTVDEVTSKGSRGSGRMLSVTAKGMDTTLLQCLRSNVCDVTR